MDADAGAVDTYGVDVAKMQEVAFVVGAVFTVSQAKDKTI